MLGVDSDGVLVYISAVDSKALEGQGAAEGAIALSLYDLREVDASGDVGAIAANGGLLASDTTPILRGSATESQEVSWATGNADLVAAQVALPPNVDGTHDVTVELWVASGTTDLATFTVETSWDAGAVVSDSAVDPAASATVHRITATIAAADIPDAPAFLTLMLTPAAHATDTIQLHSLRLSYTPRGDAAA
jgi:hypothetical protein